MASPNQSFCSKCQQTFPVDMFTVFSNGMVKSWCKVCCNQAYHDKKNGVQEVAKSGPIKKNMKKNDRTCENCGVVVKTFNYPLHFDCMHKVQKCEVDGCNFETDCFGDLIWHAKEAHDLTIQPPIRGKRNYTCQKHFDEHDVKSRRRYYGNSERRVIDNEQARLRYNKRKAEGDVLLISNKRISTQNRDATVEQKEKVAAKRQTVEERLKAKRYEDCEIRKLQAAFRERMSHTISQRKNWKYANTPVLRQYYRTHHAKYRERRNAASLQYRVGNKTLKLQQIKNSCQRVNREFLLPDEMALKMFDMPCFYCGELPTTASKCQLNGIDRVDNFLTYVETNVVPCCPTCNYMKKAIEVKLFIARCQYIYKNLVLCEQREDGVVLNINERTLDIAKNNAHLIEEYHSQMYDIRGLLNNNHGKMVVMKNAQAFDDDLFSDIITESKAGPFSVADDANKVKAVLTIISEDQNLRNLKEAYIKRSKAASSVKSRGVVEWNLTIDEAVALTLHANCSYCGFPAKEEITLDRVDSTQGYVLENVVPSCLLCNVIKNDLTLADFLDKVVAIATIFDKERIDLQIQTLKREANLPVNGEVKCKHDAKPPAKCLSKKFIVEDLVIVDLETISHSGKVNVYHSKEHCRPPTKYACGSLEVLKTVFPNVTPCRKCVASKEDIQVMNDIINNGDVPAIIYQTLTMDLMRGLTNNLPLFDKTVLEHTVRLFKDIIKERNRLRKQKSRCN